MLSYHLRAQKDERGCIFFSVFGFQGGKIQIGLTSLLWNPMSAADSGKYLLGRTGLQPGGRDETSITLL